MGVRLEGLFDRCKRLGDGAIGLLRGGQKSGVNADSSARSNFEETADSLANQRDTFAGMP